jgi:hypothetical protein
VSLANLDEEEYPKIGEHLKQAAESYYEEFQAHQNGKH